MKNPIQKSSNPFEDSEVARRYAEIDKSHYFKWGSIFPTVLGLLGDVKGRTILDVGCGYGAFSEMLIEKGAKVVGIDSSPKMIRMAQARQNTNWGRYGNYLSYFVMDAKEGNSPLAPEGFDFAVANLFFNYVESLEGIEKICNNIYSSLKEGAGFIAFQNQFQDVDFKNQVVGNVEYKFKETTSQGADVWQLTRKARGNSQPLNILSWRQLDYTLALNNAGFRSIRWHNPILSQEAMDQLPKQDILNYIKSRVFRGFVARK